jgi:hypothetical protein
MSKNYDNMTGLILFSDNPFAIKNMHKLVKLQDGDTLRKEIILTKYHYARMTDSQRSVYRALARGKFHVNCTSHARLHSSYIPITSQYQLEKHREVIACDVENDIVVVCRLSGTYLEPYNFPEGHSHNIDIPKMEFSTDSEICRLFYWMIHSLQVKEQNLKDLTAIKAEEDLHNHLVQIYKD